MQLFFENNALFSKKFSLLPFGVRTTSHFIDNQIVSCALLPWSHGPWRFHLCVALCWESMLLERMLWSLLPPDTLNISKAVNNMLTDFFALLPEVFSFIERYGGKPHRTSLKSAQTKEIVIPEPVLSEPSSRAVVWFRSGDLRSRDHCGLQAAVKAPNGPSLLLYLWGTRASSIVGSSHGFVEGRSRWFEVTAGRAWSLSPYFIQWRCRQVSYMISVVRWKWLTFTFMKIHWTFVSKASKISVFLCAEHTKLWLQRWRAPLRLAVGSLGQCATYDDYVSAVEAQKISEISEPCELLDSLVVDPIAPLESQSECDEWQNVIPTLEELQENLRVSSNREQFLFSPKAKVRSRLRCRYSDWKGSVSFARPLCQWRDWSRGHRSLGRSRRYFASFPKKNGHSVALLWDQMDIKAWDQEKSFSRALSEEMLWLGCISMRTVAKRAEEKYFRRLPGGTRSPRG